MICAARTGAPPAVTVPVRTMATPLGSASGLAAGETTGSVAVGTIDADTAGVAIGVVLGARVAFIVAVAGGA